MSNKFSGVGAALITPFSKDLAIDFKTFERVLEHVAKGANYFVVQGTTGESATTSMEEKHALLEFVKTHNPKELPIVFGAGWNNTAEVISFINSVDFEGVDAILSASPHYNKPSQEGIYQHFKVIADEAPVPVILYNVPGRTASNISAATTLRLARHPNIIGIKEASGDWQQCIDIAANMPSDFLLISGDDLMTNSLITLGAVGVISVMANPFPNAMQHMVSHALEGNFKASNDALFKLIRVNHLMYQESNPVGAKEAMRLLGICENYVRMPLIPASVALSAELSGVIEQYQLN